MCFYFCSNQAVHTFKSICTVVICILHGTCSDYQGFSLVALWVPGILVITCVHIRKCPISKIWLSRLLNKSNVNMAGWSSVVWGGGLWTTLTPLSRAYIHLAPPCQQWSGQYRSTKLKPNQKCIMAQTGLYPDISLLWWKDTVPITQKASKMSLSYVMLTFPLIKFKKCLCSIPLNT